MIKAGFDWIFERKKLVLVILFLPGLLCENDDNTDYLLDVHYQFDVIDGKLEPEEQLMFTRSKKSETSVIARHISDCQALCVTGESSFQPCINYEELNERLDFNLLENEVLNYFCVKESSARAGNFVSQYRDKKLTRNALKKLNSLTSLVIFKIGITDIEEYFVDEMKWLEELRIEFNNITLLQKKIFYGANKLKTLSLQGNGIVTIENGIFDGLTKVEVINLSYNMLESLKWILFKDTVSLKVLQLNHNNLARIQVDAPTGWSLGGSELAEIKDRLTEVGTLDLQNNKLQFIDPLLLRHVPNLEKLNVSNNIIKRIKDGTFESMSHLRSLDISGNKLRVPNPSLYYALKPGDNKEPVELRLGGNEWKCDCDVLPYYEFFIEKEKEFHDTMDSMEAEKASKDIEIVCHTPATLTSKVLNEDTVAEIMKSFRNCKKAGDVKNTDEKSPSDRDITEKVVYAVLSEHLLFALVIIAVSMCVSFWIIGRNRAPVIVFPRGQNRGNYNVGQAIELYQNINAEEENSPQVPADDNSGEDKRVVKNNDENRSDVADDGLQDPDNADDNIGDQAPRHRSA